jgi:hypothetical protein
MGKDSIKSLEQTPSEAMPTMFGDHCRKKLRTILSCGAVCGVNPLKCCEKGKPPGKSVRSVYYLLKADDVVFLHTCILPKLRRLPL